MGPGMAPENPFVSRSSYRQISTGLRLSATNFLLLGRFNVRKRSGTRGFIALGLAAVRSTEHLIALAACVSSLADEEQHEEFQPLCLSDPQIVGLASGAGHVYIQRIAASAIRKDRG